MNVEGSNSKNYSVVEALNSASTNPRDTQGIGQDCARHTRFGVVSDLCLCPECLVSVPPADNRPSTDKLRPSEGGAPIGIEGGVSSVSPDPLVENTFEGSMHGAVKSRNSSTYPRVTPLIIAFNIGSEQERFSTIDTSGSENLAHQTKEPVYFAVADSGVAAAEPEVSAEKHLRLL